MQRRGIVYYLFEAGQAPQQPLARFTEPGDAHAAARALETLGRRAELLSREESPGRTRPSAWSVEYSSSDHQGST